MNILIYKFKPFFLLKFKTLKNKNQLLLKFNLSYLIFFKLIIIFFNNHLVFRF